MRAPTLLSHLLILSAAAAEMDGESAEIVLLRDAADVAERVASSPDCWVVLFTDEEDTLLTQWFELMTMHQFNIAMRWGVAPASASPHARGASKRNPMWLFAVEGGRAENVPVRVQGEALMRKALEYLRDALISSDARDFGGVWKKRPRNGWQTSENSVPGAKTWV